MSIMIWQKSISSTTYINLMHCKKGMLWHHGFAFFKKPLHVMFVFLSKNNNFWLRLYIYLCIQNASIVSVYVCMPKIVLKGAVKLLPITFIQTKLLPTTWHIYKYKCHNLFCMHAQGSIRHLYTEEKSRKNSTTLWIPKC